MMKSEAEGGQETERLLKEFSIDNCRVCIDIKDWSKRAQRLAFAERSVPHDTTATVTATAAAALGTAAASTDTTNTSCPPDALDLGRSTWTFLHTMAAYYPEAPTPTQQAEMGTFISLFSKYYPCGYCAAHLREEMVKDPPQTQSRSRLARWFCRMHNEVNERLGKPFFDCDRLDERWRDGPADGSCN